MTVAQKFVIELPNESYVEESGTGVGGFQYELSREQAEELYNDLRVALGYSVRANDPGDAQDAQLAPPSAEELAAREQVLAALALQANPEPKERRDGSAIGSGPR